MSTQGSQSRATTLVPTPAVTAQRAAAVTCAAGSAGSTPLEHAAASEASSLEEETSEESGDDGEDGDAYRNEADAVDIETVEELSEKKRIARMQRKLNNIGLIGQAGLEPQLQTWQVEAQAARQIHTMSERRRRWRLRDMFLQLQQVLGMPHVSRVSRYYVLKQALDEIQALVEKCERLEEKKRRMTQKRAVYIRMIAQRSGKTEELIIGKLQDICAKQRSLEAHRKRVAPQQALGPDRNKNPLPQPQKGKASFCQRL
ncbi:hypothetical protein AAFF_G00214330 [Aldrovandia affinis]|uniref:BHLH domain-containing protein n=1 Tax=Aldrovandia affinis TaxID=143900 RepID=A0AAD7W568_9TELE|nr:hypothetical protein AAFF_G00214330 [Aldrovandia affinis]